MNELLELLRDIKNNVDYENCDDLIDGKVFDSIELIELITRIEENFDIEIDPDEISPQNFNSVKTLWQMIERLSVK